MNPEAWLALAGLALAIVGQIFYFGSRLGRMEERLRTRETEAREAEGRAKEAESALRAALDTDRKDAKESQAQLLKEIRGLREDLHSQAVGNQDRYLRADFAARTDTRFAELWEAVDALRKEKLDRDQAHLLTHVLQQFGGALATPLKSGG